MKSSSNIAKISNLIYYVLNTCDRENNIWMIAIATFICKFCISTLVEEAASGKAIKWRGFATDIDIECEMNPFHKIWRKEDNSDRLMNHRKGKKFNHAFCQTKHSWSVMNISMMSFIWSNLPSSSNHHLRKTLVLCRLTHTIKSFSHEDKTTIRGCSLTLPPSTDQNTIITSWSDGLCSIEDMMMIREHSLTLSALIKIPSWWFDQTRCFSNEDMMMIPPLTDQNAIMVRWSDSVCLNENKRMIREHSLRRYDDDQRTWLDLVCPDQWR